MEITAENINVYKPVIKNFMGVADVRVIEVGRDEYVVCKDMFDALGLVRGDGTWTNPREKMLDFLEVVNKTPDHQTFGVRFKDKQSPKGQVREVECLNIETAPLVITQFKPTARRGKEALDRWVEFMNFVDSLLKYHECHKFIFLDKDHQKSAIEEITEAGGKPVIVNQQVNRIMGKLILGEDSFPITKDELKIYQPQVTIDLLSVREFVLDKFKNAYEFTNSHKEAYEMALKLAQRKYHFGGIE